MRALLALPLLFAACAAQPAPAGDAPSAITIDQGPCFGFCPVYTMTLTPGDHYTLEGRRFARTEGRTEGRLPAGSFEAAARALDAAGFHRLPADVTGANADICPHYMSDLPTYTITAMHDGARSRVVYDQGCHHEGLNALIEALQAAMAYETLILPPR